MFTPAQMPSESARSNAALVAGGGRLFLVAGLFEKRLTSIDCYDPAKDAWETCSEEWNMSTPRLTIAALAT